MPKGRLLALVGICVPELVAVVGVVGWWAALRVGAADRLMCLDPSRTTSGVYETDEADSSCTPLQICVDHAVRPMADRLRAADCRPEYGD